MKETIYIGSDHAGFKLKEKLKRFLEKNYEVIDLGPKKFVKTDDYPDYALKVARKVKKTRSKGILICGTGQGISIAANKIKGIISALVWNKSTAKHSKKHLNANIISLPSMKFDLARNIVKIWMDTPFKKVRRHVRRINKIKRIK